MDTDNTFSTNPSNEKKPKRPRIGQRPLGQDSEGHNNFSRQENDGDKLNFDSQYGDVANSSHRPYNSGYQQRNFNNRGASYQQTPRSPYYNRQQSHAEGQSMGSESNDGGSSAYNAEGQQSAYQPRSNNYRQGGYSNRQGAYNKRPGGYNNNRQGGYNNNRQGGYNNRQGGYGNQQNYGTRPVSYNRNEGYEDSNNSFDGQQRGGYGNNQGGYGYNRQGGYKNHQGGYNNRQGGSNRQGGYNNRQGGYNNRQGAPGNNRQGGLGKGKSFTPRPRAVDYELPIPDPNETVRLNKFMANAGICSRREADEFIQQGLVKVNGVVVTELGTKIKHSDVVEYDEKVVALERKCYILLNKPKDCVTTSDDPNGRLTVLDLVKNACKERIYPVGRLDRNTTGVLLLTNDGDLASKLTHPKYVKKKIYHVWTDRDISEEDMQRIADGIELDDGEIHADAISYATEEDRNQVGIEIHSGRNRIVRRIFESLGYHVTKLDRVYFAGLTKKNLPRGRWRYLTQEEVNFLKMGSFEQ